MDDSELTRKAIEELVREIGNNGKSMLGPQERKVNPLGKPNKRFLDRTLNFVMRHNEREQYRTQASSQQKLRELNDNQKLRAQKACFNIKIHEHSRRQSRNRSNERRSCSRSSNGCSSLSKNSSIEIKPKSKLRKRSKHKRQRRRKNNSRSRGSSTSSECSEYGRKIKEEQFKHHNRPYYYTQPNPGTLAAMAIAYNHLQQVANYQAMTNSIANIGVSGSTENDHISNVSISGSLTEELKLTSDDDCGILTINISSSDDNNYSRNISENSSSCSCTPLDSDEASVKNRNIIVLISSSDSDDNTVGLAPKIKVQKQAMIDLTDD